MPLTRIRQTAIGNDSITTAKLDDTSGGLTLPGVEYVKVPVGTTAQRPSSPVNGYMRYNTNFERLEQYSNGQWQSIDTPPSITSLSHAGSLTVADPAGGETITLAGSNFQAGATVTVGGTSATSVSVVSSTSITFTTPAKTAGDYDVTVSNANGLAATLLNGISYNGVPSFTTAAGNVGSIAEDVAMSTITIVAAEPDGGTLAYSITSGALPTGVSMSSAGAITGTPNINPSANTTFNFTVTATDDESQTNSRAFNLIVLRPIYATSIDNSLRFNDDDSAYLSRTPSSASNRRTWTWSGWVKRGNIETFESMFAAQSSSSNRVRINFGTNHEIQVYGEYTGGTSNSINLQTNARFRDPTAWLHIVLALDTTQSTASDRAKLYVNGTLQTLSASTYPSQNDQLEVNTTNAHFIGQKGDSSEYFDGYLSDVHFIDGQALTPTSFAEEYYGVWVPKSYSGAFGTNGFHLPFIQGSGSGNSAFFSDAGNSYVQFSNASYYDIASGDDFTIEFFFNFTDTGEADYSYIFGNYVGTSGPYLSIQYSNSANSFYFYYGNGQSYSMPFGAGNVVANRWHHLAINRTSGTMQTFLDGTRIYNGTNTTSWDNSNVRIGQAQSNGSNGFDGYLSNVRMVVGSAVYAAGTTITVPTSTLTSVTNTKLLALTTSTITEDASSNNVTGTLSGSGYFSSTNAPFGAQFYNDASSNGNNFNANGLSTTDLVSDSPTNNFATMNSLLRSTGVSITYSDGNLKATSPTSSYSGGGISTYEVDSGKWYWEVRINAEATAGSNNYSFVGASTDPKSVSVPNSSNLPGAAAGYNGWNYEGDGSVNLIGTGTVAQSSVTAPAVGDILGFAVDLDNGNVYFYHNGTAQNSGNPVITGVTNLPTSPSVGVYNSSGVTFNFGQDSTFAGATAAGGNADGNGIGDFKYSPRTGFLALCTKNLSESTINTSQDDRPEDYFTTTLYVGDNSNDRTIPIGFTPDFVWLKARNSTATHILYDSIRGNTHWISIAGNSGQSTNSSLGWGDSGPTTGGFKVYKGTNASINNTGTNMVAWTWKAGGAPTATNSAGAGAVPTSGSVMINGVASTSALAGTNPVNKLSANTKSGFSIVNYTGDAANTTKAHGLGKKPSFVICKKTGATGGWVTWHQDLDGTENDKYMYIDSVSGTTAGTTSDYWSGGFDANVFGGWTSGGDNNNTGSDYIAYVWAEIDGFSKFGSYTGNANASGPYVHCGFKPSFVLMANTSLNVTWYLIDNKIGNNGGNSTPGKFLMPSNNNTEDTPTGVDFLANGFKIKTTGGGQNGSGQKHIFMAFAEDPFKYAEAK